jgi:CRP-like cAMP-binding protein
MPTRVNVADRTEERNLLLAALPPDEFERLLPKFQRVSLDEDHVLIEPFKPISHVYFPFSGAISLVMSTEQGQHIEAGLIGNEGLTGVCLSLGADWAPMRAVTQTRSYGLEMRAGVFRAEMRCNGPLADAVRRYAQGYMVMLAQGLVCMRAHRIEQRCARWLLMLHDRIDREQVRLTHNALARMLGVRRATVSEVAANLQSRGLVHYERGVMRIMDRAGLERAACECYWVMTSALTRLVPARRPRSRKP